MGLIVAFKEKSGILVDVFSIYCHANKSVSSLEAVFKVFLAVVAEIYHSTASFFYYN